MARSGRVLTLTAILCATVGLFTPSAATAGADAAAAPLTAADPSLRVVDLGERSSDASPGTAESPASGESVIGQDGRTKVTDTTAYPARAIGQLIVGQNGDEFICTGWLIDLNTILTSGHCAFNPTPGGGDIIEYATFAPGRSGAGTDPFGTCPVYQVLSPVGWRQNGLPQHDWAAMQLGTNNAGTITTCDIGTTVGWFGLSWKRAADALTDKKATVQGYPGDKADGTQWTMKGKIAKSTKSMVFYPMDTFGGQSGSPVFRPASPACGGGPCGLAVHSYGAGLPGPGGKNNAGPRITEARYNTIMSFAETNTPA